MKTGIEEVTANIYHIILDEGDSCVICSENLLEFIKNHKVLSHYSVLILELGLKRCNTTCNQDFLSACSRFEAIAYVVKEETATYDSWAHAILVRKVNTNTGYFDTYEDALNWSIEYL
jgi:hypothetical protein